MLNPINKLSIRSRIHIGFFLVSSCVVLISFISIHGNRLTVAGFDEYAEINEKVKHILIVDNRVSSLQRRVQEYIYTGYEAVADQVLLELAELDALLKRNPLLLADGNGASDYLARMKHHLGRYAETFQFAIEEKRNRNLYVEDIKRSLLDITEADDIPVEMKTRVILMQKNVFQYINDPDILLADASLEALDRDIAGASGPTRLKLELHKRNFIRVIQSTRGFLFLITVVMAGEAQEFKYLSNALLERVLGQAEPVRNRLEDVLQDSRSIVSTSSLSLILLSVVLSYAIVLSINRPLSDLTRTFRTLAANQTIDRIPGIHLEDEIGSMSRAAEVFRQNNEKTRELVEELNDKKRKLEKSNKELEQFAYIASHDLQEPLRTLTSFSRRLDKEYHELLDQRGKTYVNFIAESSNRMHSLIHGLLEYSRIGRISDKQPVDLNRVVDNVIQDLATTIENRSATEAQILGQHVEGGAERFPAAARGSATVRIGHLPEICGNELELTSLYTNLVSNALKFVVADCQPRVEIGCEDDAGGPVFFVRDNGIGIDPAHQDRIFKIFQRLQNRNDYAGNGIGLAHCKKIIESHEGNIWLDSAPGQGSSFYFTFGRAA